MPQNDQVATPSAGPDAKPARRPQGVPGRTYRPAGTHLHQIQSLHLQPLPASIDALRDRQEQWRQGCAAVRVCRRAQQGRAAACSTAGEGGRRGSRGVALRSSAPALVVPPRSCIRRLHSCCALAAAGPTCSPSPLGLNPNPINNSNHWPHLLHEARVLCRLPHAVAEAAELGEHLQLWWKESAYFEQVQTIVVGDCESSGSE